MLTAYTTWRATSGNGRPTGIAPMRSASRPSTANRRKTRSDRQTASIPMTAMFPRPHRSASRAAALSCAAIRIASATGPVHGGALTP
ncbi:hypothetical protein G6F32_016939 [Rhizopus arrhizus]|nr:hypothetical protein G6F32_016939 [Rhizopus arrhizus]